jgi:hypothetical protein
LLAFPRLTILVRLSQHTGDKKYLDWATKAATYLWDAYGSKSFYCGACSRNTGV